MFKKILVVFLSGNEMEIEVKNDIKVAVNGYNELIVGDSVCCWNVDFIHVVERA